MAEYRFIPNLYHKHWGKLQVAKDTTARKWLVFGPFRTTRKWIDVENFIHERDIKRRIDILEGVIHLKTEIIRTPNKLIDL